MEFNYYGEDFIQFETDFNQLYTGDVPLTFLTDDFLECMIKGKTNYFNLPAHQATDNRNHIFYFKKAIVNHQEVFEFSKVD